MALRHHFGEANDILLRCISAHPFIKKEWYKVQVPSNFDNSAPTLTPCNKPAGQSKYELKGTLRGALDLWLRFGEVGAFGVILLLID